MRRSGFTMVELIFVIIIIGILSAAAIPKFGDIRDRAKVNSEVSSLSGLDGAIIGAIEFQREDNDNMNVQWHDEALGSDPATEYANINSNKRVLRKIMKKGDDLKIVAYTDLNENGTATDSTTSYDILFMEGAASNKTNGVKKDTDVTGKPDSNDFWVFNASPLDMNISDSTANTFSPTMVESGELKLIDSNSTVAYGSTINIISSDGSSLVTAVHPSTSGL